MDNYPDFTHPQEMIPGYNATDSFHVNVATTNATTPILVKSLTTGKSIYISDLTISASGATRVDLQDGDATVYSTIYLGANTPYVKKYSTLKKLTEAKALMIQSSAAVPLAIEVDGIVV